MGILDDALSSQDGKRSQRFSREARKAKIEANKIKEGTYRGIDLVDGTARIQLDGQSTTTSGYRLITNAPLGDGDRVSIRPNGVGLPRADARNVAPKVEDVIEDVIEVEIVFASLVYIIGFGNPINSFGLLTYFLNGEGDVDDPIKSKIGFNSQLKSKDFTNYIEGSGTGGIKTLTQENSKLILDYPPTLPPFQPSKIIGFGADSIFRDGSRFVTLRIKKSLLSKTNATKIEAKFKLNNTTFKKTFPLEEFVVGLTRPDNKDYKFANISISVTEGIIAPSSGSDGDYALLNSPNTLIVEFSFKLAK